MQLTLPDEVAAVVRAQGMPEPPVFHNTADHRRHIRERLAAGFRLFAKYGMDLGGAGHTSARDPEDPDTFWVNPIARPFARLRASDMIRVDHQGRRVEGSQPMNIAAFAIHSRVHAARPEINAASHVHSPHGCAFSALGRLPEPITQDACAFLDDVALYDDFGGAAVELAEGERIARATHGCKAAILQNHGLVGLGGSVDSAVWWVILLERCCQVQLMAEAAAARTGQALCTVRRPSAEQSYRWVGTDYAGWLDFQPLFEQIVHEQPDLLD